MSALARWISIVGHPFVMAAIMVAGIALHFGTPPDAFRAVALVSAIAVVPLGVFILRQVRSGSWSNVDASDRSERPALFAVGIAGLAVLLNVAYVFQPHTFLLRGTFGVLLMLAVCALATKWVKVSLHSAFASLAAATLLLIDSPAGWFLLAFLPLMAWSRLALKRHTTLEVATGVLVGAITAYAIVAIEGR